MVDHSSIFVYLRNDLPPKVNEYVTPCADGYTVYINARLDRDHQFRAYNHALKHIENGDFDLYSEFQVQEMELIAHDLKCDPVPGDQFRKDLQDELLKEQRACAARLRKITARNKWLESHGVDMFAVAENQWLDPEWS